MGDSKPSGGGGGGGSKSRTGCSECKRKRVKCDEVKPTCSKCHRHPERCSYALKLSWTQGRPFKKAKTKEPTWMVGQAQFTSADTAPPSRSSTIQPELETAENVNADPFVNKTATGSELEDTPIQDTEIDDLTVLQTCQELPTSAGQEHISPDSLSQFEDLVLNTLQDEIESADEVLDEDTSLVLYRNMAQSTVPPSLSTYPLLCPSESPNSYFFLHHYITYTSGSLFPLVPRSVHQDVLSIAASTPHLLSAALALSCDQYRQLTGNDTTELRNRAMFFSRKAIAGLRRAMDDPREASSFSTICTVLFLCTNEVMAGDTVAWRTHLRGAEQLLSLALGKSRREAVLDLDTRKLFLIRWFALVDIFSDIMSLDKTASSHGQYWSVGSPADGSAQYIDEFVGFSLELMPILARIGRMARLQQRRKSLGPSLDSGYAEMADDLNSLLADNIMLTEQQLSLLFSRASSPLLSEAHDPILAQEAQFTHQMHVHAALLHLYRRVQELPKPDPKPAQALASLIGLVEQIRPNSPATVLHLWPLFTAGCEAEDPEQRAFLEARLSGMRQYGWGNVNTALDVMRSYWADGGGERWDVFLERRGIEVVLF